MKHTVDASHGAKTETPDLQEYYQDERVAHLMRLCARGFNRSLTRRLADHDVSFGQWTFLRILWKQEGLTQRELSEYANLTEPTVHTALTKLEKEGMISRRTLEGNRKKQYVFLTKKGRDLQTVLEPLAVETNNIGMKGFTPEQQVQLRNTLLIIFSNLEADEAEAEAKGVKVPPTRGNIL